MASLSGVVWAVLLFVWGVFGALFFLNFLGLSGLLNEIAATISVLREFDVKPSATHWPKGLSTCEDKTGIRNDGIGD